MSLETDIKQSKFNTDLEKLIINILYTSNWLNLVHHSFFKQFSLSAQQYNILRILRGQYPKPATINLLIDRMLDKMSNASRLVEKLKQKDFVERKQNSIDRRAVDVIITKKGLAILEKIDPLLKSAVFSNIANISEAEAKQVNDILDKLRENKI